MIVINDNFRERHQLHWQSIIQGKNLFVLFDFLENLIVFTTGISILNPYHFAFRYLNLLNLTQI